MDDSGGSAGPIIGGLVGVLIVMLVIFLALDCKKKKKIKEQEEVIQRKELELKIRDAELKAFSIGKTKYGDAVAYIDTTLHGRDMDENEMEKLALVKNC